MKKRGEENHLLILSSVSDAESALKFVHEKQLYLHKPHNQTRKKLWKRSIF